MENIIAEKEMALAEKKISGAKGTERLQSLDVMRGFDMLWIIGGGSLIIALAKSTQWVWLQALAEQMEHVQWQGFHFEDLIFPMFMFISGVAIPFAINSKIEKGTRKGLLLSRIIKRGIILVLLGILYNGALEKGFVNVRVASVLAQIGLGYLFAAIINLYTKTIRAKIFWITGILAGIAYLQLAFPVPGFGPGLLDAEGGVNAWIDQMLLPGKLYGKTFDPEGLLCIVSAISVTLMGSVAGSILRGGKIKPGKKALLLTISGFILVLIALLLSPVYPIIKKAWTVPFNLLTAGISSMLLSFFYFTIDVKSGKNKIASFSLLFFKVIGMNSITIYLATRIINFTQLSRFFTGWLAIPFGDWIAVAGAITLEWFMLYYLYKKKIFLKV
jgi:predicted acyltransferase